LVALLAEPVQPISERTKTALAVNKATGARLANPSNILIAGDIDGRLQSLPPINTLEGCGPY
jgi:hypothetical protein